MADSASVDPAKARAMGQKFVQFIMMQAQNVLYVLGRIPTPDGRALPPDLASAKMFIDQLEAIEFKTQGNLSPQEAKLLQDALAQLRLAFVEASGGTPPSMMPDRGSAYDFPDEGDDLPEDAPEQKSPLPPATRPTAPTSPPPPADPAPAAEESKKKFTKSYG